MPRPNKRRKQTKRLSESRVNKQRRIQRKKARWRAVMEEFDDLSNGIANQKGKSRTYEENRMLLLAIKATLKRHLESVSDGSLDIKSVNWTDIETEVAADFKYKLQNVRTLRKQFFVDGDVVIFGDDPENKRGAANHKYNNANYKMTPAALLALTEYVDSTHLQGMSVTNRKMINHLRDKHQLEVSSTTIRYCMKKLGLSWRPMKRRKKKGNAYRPERIRDFLVDYNEVHCHIQDSNEKKYVFVYIDESYVNQNHCFDHSYGKDSNDEINRGQGKGRRLIILNAITKDGPIAEIDTTTGKPVDGDLKWKGDTPHPPQILSDGRLTCETLWIAQSHSGDYHDNMNSDRFIQWVEGRLFPTFKKVYPGHIMVTVLDNAPYHHKREIGSLQSIKKENLVALMVQHGVDYLDLPLSSDERWQLILDDDDRIEDDRGESIRISFEEEEQTQRASSKQPLIATVDELQVSFLNWLKDNKPHLLECRFESRMKEEGYKIVWTPPYCPKLQPIEMFWAAGKNQVARHFDNHTKMKDVIRRLRDCWYGNENTMNQSHIEFTRGVDCQKLVNKCIDCADTEYIPLSPGLEGRIGALQVDQTHQRDTTGIPIDSLVVDMTKDLVIIDE